MRDLDASAFDTHDCSVPGCPDEARERGGLCSYHATSSDRPTLVAPGSHAHLMEEETPVNTCRMPGCTNASAGKGGWCVGLCDEHISIEGTRRQAVRRERLQAEKPQKPKAVKPPPVAKTSAVVPTITFTPTLVGLAQAVEDTHRAASEAITVHYQAKAALTHALEALDVFDEAA